MTDFTPQWRQIFARQRRAKKLMALHLLVTPLVIFLGGYALSRLLQDDPVIFYVAGFVYFVGGLIYIALRYDPFDCPRCGAKVRAWNRYNSPSIPVPCSECGLVRPLLKP